jgi:ABC-type transport system substrate-binding protein
MAFYGTLATASSWIVPKNYIEKVGDDGFKKAPVGLGPYKFVSNTPGIEIVMEANESYWRKMPSVKRLVFKSVPEPTTRAAMLKKGEVDIAYLLDAPTALELKRDPNFRLAFSGAIGIHFLDFFDQWDPKSPWHDRRVRLAANYAIDRRSLNEAENLGASRLTGAMVRALPLRSGKGQALAGRGWLPQRLRRRGPLSLSPVFLDGGGRRHQSRGRGYQDEVPHHGARRLPGGVAVEEIAGALRLHPRALRQRGLANGPVRPE